jgi:hypothetical protein
VKAVKQQLAQAQTKNKLMESELLKHKDLLQSQAKDLFEARDAVKALTLELETKE